MRYPTTVTPTAHERSVLATPSSSPQTALRRRIVLLAADGWFNVDIAVELGIAVSTVALWRGRFAADGLAGLDERRRTGRPRQVDRAAILRSTLRPSPDGPHGSSSPSRRLADELGVSVATVRRTWQEFGVIPRSDGAFAFRVEPELVAATVDIVGIYRTPRYRVAALVLGERSATSSDPRTFGPAGSASSSALTVVPAAHATRSAPVQPAPVQPAPDRPAPDRTAPDRPAPDQGLTAFVARLAVAHAGHHLHLVGDGAGLVRRLRALGQTSPSTELSVHLALDAASWSKLVRVWQLLADRSDPGAEGSRPATRSIPAGGSRVVWFEPPAIDGEAAS